MEATKPTVGRSCGGEALGFVIKIDSLTLTGHGGLNDDGSNYDARERERERGSVDVQKEQHQVEEEDRGHRGRFNLAGLL